MADFDAVARACVNELTMPEIDPDVRNPAIRVEEDQVPSTRSTDRWMADVVLRIRRSRQRNAEHCKDVLDEARAVEPRGRGASKDVRDAKKA